MMTIVFAVGIYIWTNRSKYPDMDPSWGMGTKVTEAVSNDRGYEWYRDQMDTGRNAYRNCGPTVIEMAARWQNENSTITTEEIVDRYIPDEKVFDGASFGDLAEWMEELGVDMEWLPNFTKESVVEEIDKGNILIIGVNLNILACSESETARCGEYFYYKKETEDINHFIIVKGYRVVDGVSYFETYDPGSYGSKYEDGEPIGKNRYYEQEDFIKSAHKFYHHSIVISK